MRVIFYLTAIAVMLTACTVNQTEQLSYEDSSYSLDSVYRDAARRPASQRRPVVFVPGTLGSRLSLDGEMIWGGQTQLSPDPDSAYGLRALTHPIGPVDEPLRAMRDGVRTAGLLDVARVRVLGVELREEAYEGTYRVLRAGGFTLDDGLVPFAYDWRRDLVEAAQGLYALTKRLSDERRARGLPPKVDLIAHSTGVLVARYFLRYGDQDLPADGSAPRVTWAGADLVDRVMLVGPPNFGAPKAFENIVNGRDFGVAGSFSATILASHVPMYQLMPRPRHRHVLLDGDSSRPVDIYDPTVWERFNWGMADPAQAERIQTVTGADPAEARARALAFQRKALTRARRFAEALDRGTPPPPEDLDIVLVLGVGRQMPAVISVDSSSGALRYIRSEEGDGVLTRRSSLGDDSAAGEPMRSTIPFRAVLMLPDVHESLTRGEIFGDNLLFWLLEAPR